MELYDLLYGISFKVINGSIKSFDIKDIVFDSRKECNDSIFVCIKGKNYDSHNDFELICDKGAKVIFVQEDIITDKDVLVLRVEDTRKALSYLCINYFNAPHKSMKLIGITGTMGKTSVALMTKELLQKLGYNCGLIGSLGVSYNDIEYRTENTTPQPYELNKILLDMKNAGIDVVIMEASSLGLNHSRLAGIKFDIAVMTNIMQEFVKLKELSSFDEYLDSKKRLFNMAPICILNADDEYSNILVTDKSVKVVTYGLKAGAEIRASDIELLNDGDILGIKYNIFLSKKITMNLHHLGRQNVYNSLAALSVIYTLGYDIGEHKDIIRDVKLTGRAEIIKNDFGKIIVLDCANTGLGYTSIFDTLLEYKRKKIISVITVNNVLSENEQKELLDIAISKSEVCFIVDTNNYTEGMSDNIIRCTSREKAIFDAIEVAEKDDIVLVLGKSCCELGALESDYSIINRALGV